MTVNTERTSHVNCALAQIADLRAFAERYPEHALRVRTLIAQLQLAERVDSPALRSVIAAGAEMLRGR